MEIVKRYLIGAFLLLVFLSAMTLLISFSDANCRAYRLMRNNLKSQSFEEEAVR